MKYEEKFIVINIKRLEELQDAIGGAGMFSIAQEVIDFQDALKRFVQVYKDNVGPMNQQYYVVNQDEPYAPDVWKLIKKGEEDKE